MICKVRDWYVCMKWGYFQQKGDAAQWQKSRGAVAALDGGGVSTYMYVCDMGVTTVGWKHAEKRKHVVRYSTGRQNATYGHRFHGWAVIEPRV